MNNELVGFLNIFGLMLFLMGIMGMYLFFRSLLTLLLALELTFLGINIMFVTFSLYLDDGIGQLFGFLILAVIGAESVIALALLIAYYRISGTVFLGTLSTLKG
jgi:NADH-quinone oxidoreductase subunit K